MKKLLSFTLMLFLFFALVACGEEAINTNETTEDISEETSEEIIESDYLKQFSSQEEMNDYVNSLAQKTQYYGGDNILTPEAGLDDTNEEDQERHSETNVQVSGVSEMDTIITDGNYIYMAKNQDLRIVDVESMSLVYEDSLIDETDQYYAYAYYHGIYLYEDKLIVLYDQYQRMTDDDQVTPYYWWWGSSNLRIDVLDVSDKSNIQVERQFEFKNTYLVDSRMIEGDFFIMMSSYHWWYDEEIVTPSYKDSLLGDDFINLTYEDIFYYPDSDQVSSYLMVASFNVNQEVSIDLNAYLTYAYEVYMNQENLYISGHVYHYSEEDENYRQYTSISRFKIVEGKLVFQAANQIDGWTLNQFSFDEYEGILRLATTDYIYSQEGVELTNQLYLLDATDNELSIISVLRGLGKPNERIYAVRMSQDIAYVVTFVNTDPLYKIDLSDPYHPVILGELYEEGVSDYLHPINDDLMIGIGRQADNSNGFTIFTGVKVALYDTSGDQPITLETLLVEGEYSYSPVTYDHKLFVEYEWNNSLLFAIPVYAYSYGYGQYYQAIYLYQVDEMNHLSQVSILRNTPSNYYGYIEKAIFINDKIYTISYNEINEFDMLNDFNRTSSIVFNQEVNQGDDSSQVE
ncbi:hypothetical protein HF295_03955 [Hujiaoplasma nucleasis]|uniref:Beta-propeller domain-containing protein n=1 Tax=Hujiaoplasma nucleasis TaxID=2725268 RepID=A0A7L6N4A1_9MOLU|nr:beta-propeller domain-containing protein [Hujiaoplasma nucleasis]QLY40058.1 hypothetical protein HF295_03955 [Hujiaoplasma nucleasis]